jgi:hypothetical protein
MPVRKCGGGRWETAAPSTRWEVLYVQGEFLFGSGICRSPTLEGAKTR